MLQQLLAAKGQRTQPAVAPSPVPPTQGLQPTPMPVMDPTIEALMRQRQVLAQQPSGGENPYNLDAMAQNPLIKRLSALLGR